MRGSNAKKFYASVEILGTATNCVQPGVGNICRQLDCGDVAALSSRDEFGKFWETSDFGCDCECSLQRGIHCGFAGSADFAAESSLGDSMDDVLCGIGASNFDDELLDRGRNLSVREMKLSRVDCWAGPDRFAAEPRPYDIFANY